MKRILSILAVVCLIVSLAVPTLAASTHTVSGKWVFNKQLTLPTETIGQNVNFTYGTYLGKTMSVRSDGILFAYSTDNGTTWKSFHFYTVDGGWYSPGILTVDFGTEPQTVSDSFYTWLLANATPPSCDGSACSVADYDVNGICDTCGMTLAYSVQRTYTPNTYPSSLPVLPLGFNDSDDFVVVEVNGVTYLHALVNYGDLDHWDTKASSTSYRATAYGVNGEPVITKYYKYQLVNGDWNQVQSSLTQTTTTFGKFDEVTFLYSTIDIKDSDGNLFFPVPLWMEMDRVTQGEMVQTAETVGGTMTTLVLCGVGCLALLVVLKLFGKRSLISLR